MAPDLDEAPEPWRDKDEERTAAPGGGVSALAPGAVDVRLLALTPRLDGLREELAPNRARRAVELVAYLALHQPDVITSDRLRTRVLGSSDADAASKTCSTPGYAARRAIARRHGDPPSRRATVTVSTNCHPGHGRCGVPSHSPPKETQSDPAMAIASSAPRSFWWRGAAGQRWSGYVVGGRRPCGAHCRGAGRRGVAWLARRRCRALRSGRWVSSRRIVEPYSEALSRSAAAPGGSRGDADRLRLGRECQRRVDTLDPGSSPSAPESLYGDFPPDPRRCRWPWCGGATRLSRWTERLAALYRRTTFETRPPDCLHQGRAAWAQRRRVHVIGSSDLRRCRARSVPDHLNPEAPGQPGDAPVLGLGLG